MSKKKLVFFVSWIAMLGVLAYASSRLSQIAVTPKAADPPGPPPGSMTGQMAQADWPAIIKHAAAPPRGPANAPFTMVEFGDFQCPQCGKMKPILENAIAKAPVPILFYFDQRPLPQIHAHAETAAAAACSAAAQGKFWPMYDALYANQKDLRVERYKDYADKAGLNGDAITSDVQSRKFAEQVSAAEDFCDSIGAFSTPTIVVRNNKTGAVELGAGSKEILPMLKNMPFTAPAKG
jgi:protein-disulfide isomerase